MELGRGGGRGEVWGASCSSLAATKNVIQTKPASTPQDIKNIYILIVTALTPQGKKRHLCGVISERYGTKKKRYHMQRFGVIAY